MELSQKFDSVKSDLQECNELLERNDATNIDVHLYYAVESLSEICELLASGIAELAGKTLQLAAACDKATSGT